MRFYILYVCLFHSLTDLCTLDLQMPKSNVNNVRAAHYKASFLPVFTLLPCWFAQICSLGNFVYVTQDALPVIFLRVHFFLSFHWTCLFFINWWCYMVIGNSYPTFRWFKEYSVILLFEPIWISLTLFPYNESEWALGLVPIYHIERANRISSKHLLFVFNGKSRLFKNIYKDK